jgi:hypothetical protein
MGETGCEAAKGNKRAHDNNGMKLFMPRIDDDDHYFLLTSGLW